MSFGKKVSSKPFIGNRKIDSDEALGINFSQPQDVILVDIKIDALETNPYQPRSYIDANELNELKESIEQNGLLQPIIVRPNPQNSKTFQIIAGHRRVEATKLLGHTTVRAVIMKSQERDIRVDAIIENIQRVNLSVIDEALAVHEIVTNTGAKQVDIAKMLGKSKGYVSQLVKITTLPSAIIEKLRAGFDINLSTLTEISYLEDDELKIKVFEKILHKPHTREELRSIISKLTQKEKKSEKKYKESFVFSQNKNFISFKLDLNDKSSKEKAIVKLEELLEKLKSNE